MLCSACLCVFVCTGNAGCNADQFTGRSTNKITKDHEVFETLVRLDSFTTSCVAVQRAKKEARRRQTRDLNETRDLKADRRTISIGLTYKKAESASLLDKGTCAVEESLHFFKSSRVRTNHTIRKHEKLTCKGFAR